VPTSFTLPLRISHAKGTFGTVLSGELPHVTSKVAAVTGIELNLKRTHRHRGKRHSFLSARCSPKGFLGVLPFARASPAWSGSWRGPTVRRAVLAHGTGRSNANTRLGPLSGPLRLQPRRYL
jgi:hypothetical protein